MDIAAAEARSARCRRHLGDAAGIHVRDRGDLQPCGPFEQPRQSALGRLGTHDRHEHRDAGRQRRSPGACSAASNHVVPRVSDLEALMSSTAGKIEIESMEEGRDGKIVETMLRAAVLEVFKNRFSPDELTDVVASFGEGKSGPHRRRPGLRGLHGNCSKATRRSQLRPSRLWPPRSMAQRPARASRQRCSLPPSSWCSKACTCPSGSTKKHVGARATYRGRG